MCSRQLVEQTPEDRSASHACPLIALVCIDLVHTAAHASLDWHSLDAPSLSYCKSVHPSLRYRLIGRPCEIVGATLQAEAMKMNKPLVVVGTPGRLAELSRLGTLQSHNTTILVLDEVGLKHLFA